jgi:hypothetical protein
MVARHVSGPRSGGLVTLKYLFPKGYPAPSRYLLNEWAEHFGDGDVLMVEGGFDLAAAKIALDEGCRPATSSQSAHRQICPYGDMNGDDQLGRFYKLRIAVWDA